MSPADEVRQLLAERLRLKDEIARLEAQLVHEHDKAEARIDEAEARSYRDHQITEELQRILAKRTAAGAAVGAATGIISEQEKVDDIEAFARLRARARRARRPLDDYSAEVVAAHNRAVRPAPASIAGVPLPGTAEADSPAGTPPDASRPGHDTCTVCRGAHQDDTGYPCRLFHELVDLYNDMSLNGAIFQ